MKASMTLTLPWPPSLNKYYRHVGAKVLLSAKGRQYRKDVAAAVLIHRNSNNGRTRVPGRVRVTMSVIQPDRRRHDLDNLWKSVCDSLQYVGVIEDDANIDDLHVTRQKVCKPGFVCLEIMEL